MTSYTKILTKHATNPDLELSVSFEVSGEAAHAAETKAALPEWGPEDGTAGEG